MTRDCPGYMVDGLVAQNLELLGQLKQSGDCWN